MFPFSQQRVLTCEFNTPEKCFVEREPRAHSAGMKIYGGTLTPWWYSIFTNDNWTLEKWQKYEIINNWIRTSGAFDAVIYFDKCLADPNDPKNMLPIYDSGDHLHPGDMGYIHMGDCIDLSLFK